MGAEPQGAIVLASDFLTHATSIFPCAEVPPVVFTPWVQGLQRFLAEALLPVIHAPVLHQDRDGHYQAPGDKHL